MKKITRILIQWHRWLGLILALNFLLLTGTGLLLLWRDEIESKPLAVKAVNIVAPLELNRIEQHVKLHYPDKKLLAIYWDDDQLLNARITDRDKQIFRGSIKLKFNANGELLKHQTIENGFFDTVLKLHREMLLGGTGKIIIGIIGVFVSLTVALGCLIAPQFAKIKNGLNLRLKLGNFHRFIGLATTSWLLLVTMTGIFLSFNSIIISLFLTKTLANIPESDKFVGNDLNRPANQVLEQIALELPGYRYDFFSYPDNEFSLAGRYVLIMEKGQTKNITIVEAHAEGVLTIIELPWYLKALLISEPLHFGNYGGWILKLVWTMFGLLTLIIPLSGVVIFLLRKRIISLSKLKLKSSMRRSFNIDLKLPVMLLTPSLMILGSFCVENLWKYFFALSLLIFCGLIFMQLVSFMGSKNDV